MGRVIQPTQAAEYSSKRNVVEGVAEAKIFAVSWTDSEGQRQMCLALQFGKDTEDGKPGVFILADSADMKSQLRIANPVVKQGVRAAMAAQSGTTEVPGSVSSIDVGSMESPSDGELDFLGVDVGSDD